MNAPLIPSDLTGSTLPPRRRIRPSLILLHRWIGLVLTSVFVAILLSGMVLAFRPILDPGPPAVRADGAALVRLTRTLEAHAAVDEISVTRDGRAADVSSADPTVSGHWLLASGTRAGPAARRGAVFDVAMDMHRQLLVGLGLVVEIAAWAMLGIMIAGPFLAWLRFRHSVIGWHMATGWLLLPVTITLPLTAVLMTQHIGTGSHGQHSQGAPVMMADALSAAGAHGTDLAMVQFLHRSHGSRLSATIGGRSYRLDAHGATPIEDGLVEKIHEGTWGGALSGIVNHLLAGMLLGLTGTGFWSWFARWRRDRAGGVPSIGAGGILVLHAGQTGTATRLAVETAWTLEAAGQRATVAAIGAIDPAILARHEAVLIIAATTGEGDLPASAARFVGSLTSGALEGARFSMLALGDRSYAGFCNGGEALRAAMLAAGACEIHTLVRVDGAPDAAWALWLHGAGETLSLGSLAPDAAGPRQVRLTLAKRVRLDCGGDDIRETWGLTFSIDATIAFRPGDLMRVTPRAGGRARAYSIGSASASPSAGLTLTVTLEQWRDDLGLVQEGVMSRELIDLGVGDAIEARIDRHPGFNPPDDPTVPIILIAAGSGVAPFLGFVEERLGDKDAGPVWLLFGNRRRESDYLWGEKLEAWAASGALHRLDVAFSRDPGGAYLGKRLHDAGADVVDWMINRSAITYLCGRRALADGVISTLSDVLEKHGNPGIAPAALLDDWLATGRIRLDVFD